jgi:hypothetical protein
VKKKAAASHTPEPWFAESNKQSIRGNRRPMAAGSSRTLDDAVAYMQAESWTRAEADGKRMIACVNGCKGITDPESQVPQAFGLLEWMMSFHDPRDKRVIIDAEPLKQIKAFLARAKKRNKKS